jgi:hypothetical protein
MDTNPHTLEVKFDPATMRGSIRAEGGSISIVALAYVFDDELAWEALYAYETGTGQKEPAIELPGWFRLSDDMETGLSMALDITTGGLS